MNSRTPLGLAACCLLLAGPLAAASKVWSPLPGPGGGPVDGLAVVPSNPSILYATSGQGVYKSTDQGSSWTKTGNDSPVQGALAVDPADPSIVVTGGTRSTDGGQTWLLTGGFYGIARRVAFVGSVPGLVYAVATNGLYSSLNSGTSWTNRYVSDARSMAPSPSDPLTLLVGTKNGVLKTTDGGVSFSLPQLNLFEVLDVAWGANGTALAATSLNGVFRSTDGGGSWSPASTGLPSTKLGSVAIAPNAPLVAYAGTDAGLARSSDGGLTWTPAAGFDGTAAQLVVRSASELYALGPFGLLFSPDSGGTVQPRGNGLGVSRVSALLFDPIAGSTLLVTSTSGIQRSTDSGATWVPAFTVAGQTFSTLSSGGSRLWAGSGGAGVYASTDGGQSWIPRNAGLPTKDVVALAGSPGNPGRALVSLGASGVYRTTDGGDTWSPVLAASEKVTALGFAPTDSQIVIAGTTSGGGGRILKSTDGGMAFSPVYMNLNGGAWSVALAPNDPQHILVVAYYSMQSTDGGATWGYPGLFGSGVVGFDPASPSNLYFGAASPYGTPVYKSTNGGGTFYAYSPGLDGSASGNPEVASLAFDPSTPHRVLYAGPTGLWEIRDGPMQLTSCAPTAVLSSGGTTIRLSGSNLPTEGAVGFGTSYLYDSSYFTGGDGQHIDIAAPSHAPGVVTLYVSNATSETASLPSALAFIGVVPTLTSASPPAAPSGATLTAVGSGFGPGTRFRLESDQTVSHDLFVDSLMETSVHLTLPSGYPPGKYDLVATNPVGLTARLRDAVQLLEVRPSTGFFTLTPCRALDTRLPPFVALPARGTFPIAVGCGVPSDAVAITANVTVTEPNSAGTLRVSGDFPVPEPGTVAFSNGQTRANNALLKVAPGYSYVTLNLLNDSGGTVHAIVDVSGYFR